MNESLEIPQKSPSPFLTIWFQPRKTFRYIVDLLPTTLLPDIVSGLLFIGIALVFEYVFACQIPNLTTDSTTVIYIIVSGPLLIISGIWVFILRVVGLSEILGITKGKAFLTAIIGGFILGTIAFFYEFFKTLQD